MAEILSFVSLVSFIVAAILVVVTVILWIVFKIPNVIGDLSGRNARKSIEQMRKYNEKIGNKQHSPSRMYVKKGEATSTKNSHMEKSRLDKLETGVLVENAKKQTKAAPTELLVEENVTHALNGENITKLLIEKPEQRYGASRIKIILIEEVMYIHTNEVINI